MIDPTDFLSGKPTVAQVKAVHDEMAEAGLPTSQRKVAEELNRRGFDIAHKTVGRYKNSGWRELGAGGPKPMVNGGMPRNIAKPVREAVGKLPEAEQQTLKTGLDNSVGGPMEAMELEAIANRLSELMSMDAAALGELAVKTRLAYNILLMEQSSRRAGVLSLIPKDTASLVVAMTDAVRSTPYGAVPDEDGGQPGDNAKLIEHQPQHPLAMAIDNFKRRSQAA